jgi:hypothetical protein
MVMTVLILFNEELMATKQADKGKRNDNSETNRMKRLIRTQKAQPNNKQVEQAMKGSRMRRSTPKNEVWSHTWRKIAQLYREVGGFFDPKVMSSNQDVAFKANSAPNKNAGTKLMEMPKRPFSIEERVRFWKQQ